MQWLELYIWQTKTIKAECIRQEANVLAVSTRKL